jgi:hypothetical protein
LTEFELIEALQGAEANWQGAAAIFISTVFGYIAAAYFVGSKLTRSQVLIISGLYAFFCLAMLVVLTDILQRMLYLSGEAAQLNPSGPFIGMADPQQVQRIFVFAPMVYSGVFFCAFLAGLLFMFQVRRNTKKARE